MDLKDCTIDTKQVFGPMVIQYYQINHVYAGYIPLNLEITHQKGLEVRATFATSLAKLAPHKVRVLYLHAPDRSVPFEETLREVSAMYDEGLL